MTAKIKKSVSFRDMQKKLKQLPRMQKSPRISAGLKKHAQGAQIEIIKLIKDGKTKPVLAKSTKRVYVATGRSTSTPLYQNGSMAAGLKIFKLNNGWAVRPSGMHRSGMPQKKIWTIHEMGISIPITQKMRIAYARLLGALGLLDKRRPPSRKRIVRIPARHAIRRGVNTYLRSEAKNEANADIRRAIIGSIINIGKGR